MHPDGAAPPRWLRPDAAAAHLGVRPDVLPRLVRIGRIPPPSYHLGARSPRYDRHALDARMAGEVASTDPKVAVHGLIAEILGEGRARRQA